jgi:predicted phosphodiesterase
MTGLAACSGGVPIGCSPGNGDEQSKSNASMDPQSAPGSEPSLLVGMEGIFRPTPKGCTVHWVPNGPLSCRLLTGEDPERLAPFKEITSQKPTRILLNEHPQDSSLYLQLQMRRPDHQEWISQPVRRIRTARSPGQTFRVALIADSHVYYADRSPQRMKNIDQTVDMILKDDPDFVIFLGDEGGVAAHRWDPPGFMNQQQAVRRWSLWRKAFAPILASVPSFLVIGNHEGEGGYYQAFENGGHTHHYQRWGTIARKMFLLNPLPDTYPEGGEDDGWKGEKGSKALGGALVGNRSPFQNYYAWTWGDALFVVLDVFRYTNIGGSLPTDVDQWTLGPTQLKWFEQVLNNSKARWKIVLAHHLVGGSGWNRYGTTKQTDYVYGRGGARYARVGEQARICDIMKAAGAQLFFYGHDHVFSHQPFEDLHFVCSGRPTWLSSDWWNNPGWIEAYGDVNKRNPHDFHAAIGYTRLDIGPDRFQVEYLRSGTDENQRENVSVPEGEIVHAFSLS